MAAKMYNGFWELLLKNGIAADLSAGGTAVKALLVSTAYTFDETHKWVSDVVASEVSGTGYTGGFAGSGRVALASKTVTRLLVAPFRVYLDSANVSWAGINLGATQIGGIILWLPKTNDADSPVICFDDTGGFPVTTSGGTYEHAFSADGILELGYP